MLFGGFAGMFLPKLSVLRLTLVRIIVHDGTTGSGTQDLVRQRLGGARKNLHGISLVLREMATVYIEIEQ
jgi:hypothetical protein